MQYLRSAEWIGIMCRGLLVSLYIIVMCSKDEILVMASSLCLEAFKDMANLCLLFEC